MKYKRMLCWVNQELKTELMKLSNNEHIIICTDNYENFIKEITDDSYLAISLLIAQNNLNFLKDLLKRYPNQKFHIIFDQKYFSGEVLELFTECDKRCNHYSVELLIEDFQKENAIVSSACQISEDDLMKILDSDSTLRGLAQAISEEFDKNGKYIGK